MDMINIVTAYERKLIEKINLTDKATALAMVERAKAALSDKSSHAPIETRIEILSKVKSYMQQDSNDLALLIAQEGGKPLTDAKIEVARAIDGVELCCAILRTRHGKEIPMDINPSSRNKLAFTTYEPIGIVVAISAFNHPLNLIVHQVAPAVALGCPVIVKPASTTPLSARRFVQYLHKAGLKEDFCQLCIAEPEVAEKLATHPDINFLSFIGSSAVGWMLKAKLAPGVRCALEHGGVAPVIITEDADLEKLYPKIIKGGFYHAGQVCVSVQKIFAPESEAHAIASELAERAKKLKVGDPTKVETEVGPLILPKEVDRVHAWITDAIQQGATLLCGGKKLGETTYAPTVLYSPPLATKICTQEVFGPVIVVIPYKNLDDAIANANSLPYAFQASVFSDNMAAALKIAKKLDASAVMLNDHTAFRVDWMPFGGRRHSGLGMGGIESTFDLYSQEKLFVLNF